MDEIWKPVPDYPAYEVSNFGRVKSFKQGKQRILKPILKYGYFYVMLYKVNKSKQISVHRLVAQLFIPNLDNKPEINHIDGNKQNNHVSNLEWCTSSENERHAVVIGLIKRGEEHHKAKLTNQQARYIRDNPDGLSQQKLGKIFGVEQTTIGLIQRGETYKHVGGSVRKARKTTHITDEFRKQVKAEYKAGVVGCGCCTLARKYAVSPTTIMKIIHESL